MAILDDARSSNSAAQMICIKQQVSGVPSNTIQNRFKEWILLVTIHYKGLCQWCTGVKWAVSVDSASTGAETGALAAWCAIGGALPRGTLLHRLPFGICVHQHCSCHPFR